MSAEPRHTRIVAHDKWFEDIDPDANTWVSFGIRDGHDVTWAHFHVSRVNLRGPDQDSGSNPAIQDHVDMTTLRLFTQVMQPQSGEQPPVSHMSIQEWWRLLSILHSDQLLYRRKGYWGVSTEKFAASFRAWFINYQPTLDSLKDLDNAKLQYASLLLPGVAFANEHAFGVVTKWLAYNVVGWLQEINPLLPPARDETERRRVPDYLCDLHMPKNIIRQLRNANRFLRNQLQDRIFEKIKSFTEAKCPCRIEGLCYFIKALELTDTLPFDMTKEEPLTLILESRRFLLFSPERSRAM